MYARVYVCMYVCTYILTYIQTATYLFVQCFRRMGNSSISNWILPTLQPSSPGIRRPTNLPHTVTLACNCDSQSCVHVG